MLTAEAHGSSQLSSGVLHDKTHETVNAPTYPRGTANNGSWANTMAIPWSKMPKGVKEAIANHSRPSPGDRRAMVNVVVDEMMIYHPNPNMNQVTCIAKRIVKEHPDSFEDRADVGQRIGSGSASFAKQLKNRVENKTRGNDAVRLRLKKSTCRMSSAGNVSDGENGTRRKDSYGCVNWNPSLPAGETNETLKSAQEALKEQYTLGPERWDTRSVDEGMKKTFCVQRSDINGGATTPELCEDWPFLFQCRWFLGHFDELVGSKIESLLENAGDKARRLYQFSMHEQQRKGYGKLGEVLHAVTSANLPQTDLRCFVLLVLGHFKEDASTLFRSVDVSCQLCFNYLIMFLIEVTLIFNRQPIFCSRWHFLPRKIVNLSAQYSAVGIFYLCCTWLLIADVF